MTALSTPFTASNAGPAIENAPLLSGYGQFHSDRSGPQPRPYSSITLDQIHRMLESPASVDKAQGQWVIFSTLQSRVFADQRKDGQFYALWADIDEPPDTLTEMFSRALSALPCTLLAYTSRSATEDNQKARFIVPLANPVDGQTYERMARILNDKLEGIGITPDRKTEDAGQLCYLPNQGQFYDHRAEEFLPELSAADWQTELDEIEAEEQREAEELKQQREQARLKAQQRVEAGTLSPVDAFNAEYPIPLMLNTFGYRQRGKRWLSPNSESGTPGVTITDDGRKWRSTHGSDADIGFSTSNGTMGDAFDLLVHYQHRGDRDAAIKATGEQFTVNGKTITQVNQQNYREQQAMNQPGREAPHNEPATTDDQVTDPPFNLAKFALNGQSADMESKMLDDKFVLGKLAILGQSTVIYAPPNGGKTLITIWLLIEQIKAGEINAEDVFYINADDNHKGITFKLKLAERYGFNMLAPSYNGFQADHLAEYLAALVRTDQARGKVLILDTVKKFTDIMDKRKGSEFGEAVRQFVAHGGTVIMLAHVNKHRDMEGKLVFSGTSDLKDDCDCAYILDTVSEDSKANRVVKFENQKSRGDVASESVYSFDGSDGKGYLERLESVRAVDDDEREAAERKRALNSMLERNQEAVDAIRECLMAETEMKKTDLIKAAVERSGVSRSRVVKALRDHTGSTMADHQFWHADVRDKNAHVYRLNWGNT